MKRFWAGLLCLMLLCGAVCAETLNGRNASGNVSIPYGVLNIESEAFAGCADIISLRIPETVKSLGGRLSRLPGSDDRRHRKGVDDYRRLRLRRKRRAALGNPAGQRVEHRRHGV